jgi:hypothetical protein
MPDQVLNCSTISSRAIMSLTVLVTSVPSSAYHLLASCRQHDVMSYPFLEVVGHLMRASITRSNMSGDRGSPRECA